jgi:hypothetical protein
MIWRIRSDGTARRVFFGVKLAKAAVRVDGISLPPTAETPSRAPLLPSTHPMPYDAPSCPLAARRRSRRLMGLDKADPHGR